MSNSGGLLQRLAVGTRGWPALVERQAQAIALARAAGVSCHLKRLDTALREGNTHLAKHHEAALRQFLEETEDALRLAQEVQKGFAPPVAETKLPAPTPQPVATYWISATVLAEAAAYLTQHLPGAQGEPEWMLAVTGLQWDEVYTLEHLIEVELATQSGAQASFNIEDFTRIAMILYERGQKLHAIFHSHRWGGPPHPSNVDDRLQRILEQGGYPAIQAVFSEDGYVRFFSRRRAFTVGVCGKGVISVDAEPNLFRIVHFDTLPRPTARVRISRRDDGVRSLPAHSGR